MRIMAEAKHQNPTIAVHVVANRVGEAKGEEIAKGDFEKAVQAKIEWMIPSEPKCFMHAANNGKPLAAVKMPSKAAQQVEILAKRLGGRRDADKKVKPEPIPADNESPQNLPHWMPQRVTNWLKR